MKRNTEMFSGRCSGAIAALILTLTLSIAPAAAPPALAQNQAPVITLFEGERTGEMDRFEVSFTCEAEDPDGQVVNYAIDYGDGSATETAADGMFLHNYTDNGTFSARCTATDDLGDFTRSGPLVVTVEGYSPTPGNTPPVVDDFTGVRVGQDEPFQVRFTVTGHDPDGAVAAYILDHGDGTAPQTNDTGVFTHTYLDSGTFHAFATVEDDAGATAKAGPFSVTVRETTGPGAGDEDQAPVVDEFSARRTDDTSRFELVFTCGAHDPDGTVESYTIDFGDGTPTRTNSTGVFTHEYFEGVYNAFCIVRDDDGHTTNTGHMEITVTGDFEPSEGSTGNDGDTNHDCFIGASAGRGR